jgi:2,3-bisphosphoglycerate-independent phosphoglycerate mutase
MKGVLVVIGGLGDRRCKQFGGRTPLEVAEKVNLDYMAKKGKLGLLYPVNKETAPESDTAVVCILGNEPFLSSSGVFEAIGAGIKLERGDLALRTNFGTLKAKKSELEKGKIIDRRAGRTLTTKEAEVLGQEINKIYLPRKFLFKPTIQHRGVLVMRGGFSDNITNTDPAYHIKGKFVEHHNFRFSFPLDDDENSQYTSNIINELIEQSFNKLEEHPINKEREAKGLLPANILLTRDAGIKIPELKKMKGWMAIQYMPLEIGICKVAGMEVFSFPYPEMKDFDVYENIHNALDKAIKFSINTLKKNHKQFHYAYIHFKETDIPGLDNKPHEKKTMIEKIDKKFFSFLRKFAEKNDIKVAVTSDHSTPCSVKSISSDPVPILLFGGKGQDKTEKDECVVFNEIEARKGSLGEMTGKEFLNKINFHKIYSS